MRQLVVAWPTHWASTARGGPWLPCLHSRHPSEEHKRMPFRYVLMLLTPLAGCAGGGPGFGTKATDQAPPVVADPAFLEQYAATRRFSAGRPAGIQIVPDGS